MKYTKIASAVLAALCLFACTKDPYGTTDIPKVSLSEASAFVAPELKPVGDVIVDANNNNVEAVTFNWTPASFGAPVQVAYSLYLSANGKTALAGTSFSTSYTIAKSDLNGLVTNSLGVTPNDKAQVSAYLTAAVSGTTVQPVQSQSVSFNVQTYKANIRSLFICGQFENGWDVAAAPEFWETDGGTNTYKILIDYLAGGTITPGEDQGFKILTQRAWSGDFWGYDGLKPEWEVPENNDKNFQMGASAKNLYLVTVTLAKSGDYAGTISAEGIDALSLIGNFEESGWSKDVDLVYDYKENVWTAGPVTFSGGNNGFLIRYNHAWDRKLGTATKASDYVSGGFELVEGGADMNVPGDGTYMMKIYANRTPFVIVMEKQ